MPLQDFARALVADAIDTTGRIRADVTHLRDLGRAAKHGTKVAIQAARDRAEAALQGVADGLSRGAGDTAKDWRRAHGKGRRK